MPAGQKRQDHDVAEIRAAAGAEGRPSRAQAGRDGRAPRSGGKAARAAEAARAEVRATVRRRLALCAALGALWVVGGCGGGVSGEIGRACMMGGRDAASPQLCSCIQGVANQSLSGADQRRVARFFTDPEEAEKTRASDSQRNEALWERYRAFTARAEAICG